MVDPERRRSRNKPATDVRAFCHFEMHKVNPIPHYPPQLWLFERNILKEEKNVRQQNTFKNNKQTHLKLLT